METFFSIIVSFLVALYFFNRTEKKCRIVHTFIDTSECVIPAYIPNVNEKNIIVLMGTFTNIGKDIGKGENIVGLKLQMKCRFISKIIIKPSDDDIIVIPTQHNDELRCRIESPFLKGDYFTYIVLVELSDDSMDISSFIDSQYYMNIFFHRIVDAVRIRDFAGTIGIRSFYGIFKFLVVIVLSYTYFLIFYPEFLHSSHYIFNILMLSLCIYCVLYLPQYIYWRKIYKRIVEVGRHELFLWVNNFPRPHTPFIPPLKSSRDSNLG